MADNPDTSLVDTIFLAFDIRGILCSLCHNVSSVLHLKEIPTPAKWGEIFASGWGCIRGEVLSQLPAGNLCCLYSGMRREPGVAGCP